MAGTAEGCDLKVSSPRPDGDRPRDSARPGPRMAMFSAASLIALCALAWLLAAPLPELLNGLVWSEPGHAGPVPVMPLLVVIVLTSAVCLALLLARHDMARARDAALARARHAEAARARAEAESLAKSRFLAEMSHELRTPLNTVMGFSEMMAQEVLGPHRVPAYAGYARDIHASGRHLLSLADDLLDLARIESGHRVLLETPVRLDHMGQDCLAMMQPAAHQRHVRLARDTAIVQIWGDERALRQIVLNLLTNAVKFTPAGGEVRLQAGIGPDGVPVLAVSDTGPGISADKLPLDDAHHRESRLDITTGRGAGLGLAIVRGLAQLHGGELSLMRHAGGGTLARVSLPASRLMPVAASGQPVATPMPSHDAGERAVA